jgi:hypothetical protein
MLPILRILPVGGVLLAILILVLARTPPDGPRRTLAPMVMAARGPLIDRREHPEWRQFLIRAALRRADELDRLRMLPDTPVRMAPVAPAQNEPEVAARSEPESIASPAPATPAAKVPPAPIAVQPVTPVASEPASTGLASDDSATSSEAPGIHVEDAPTVVATLPTDRPDSDPDLITDDDITGTINESPGATIPVDIGETSSTELPVVLPEERPPVIRTPERAKSRESWRKHLYRLHHAKALAKAQANPQAAQPFNLFAILFGGFHFQQPNAGWTGNGAKSNGRSGVKRGGKATIKRGVQSTTGKVAQETFVPSQPPPRTYNY